MANLVTAYVFWLIGGWWGLHHFYLGRDKHAFLWWSTCGCFCLGWIRDMWRLPEYVNAVNNNLGYLKDLNEKARRQPSPTFSVVRFAGEVIVGFLFALLVRLAIPEEFVETPLGHKLSIIVPPLGVAVGVYLVGNVDSERVDFKWPLFGSYIAIPMLTMDSGNNLVYSAILSAIFVNWQGKEWNKNFMRKHGSCKRICILTVCGLLYLSLWTSAIYFNLYITTKDSDDVPLRDAVHNFFTSPAWKDKNERFRNLYRHYQFHGLKDLWNETVTVFDQIGEGKAYKVLHLRKGATKEEIRARYIVLAKRWHPDKQKDTANKLEVQEIFIEIQQAYETLLKRAHRNK